MDPNTTDVAEELKLNYGSPLCKASSGDPCSVENTPLPDALPLEDTIREKIDIYSKASMKGGGGGGEAIVVCRSMLCLRQWVL